MGDDDSLDYLSSVGLGNSSGTTGSTNGTDTSSWLSTINSLVNTGATVYKAVQGSPNASTQKTNPVTQALTGMSDTTKLILAGAAIGLLGLLAWMIGKRK